MHPSRTLTLSAALALALSAPARACKTCDSPQPPPRFNSEPSAPFDLRVEHALTSEEREHLLALDGSRYRVSGAYLQDARPASGQGHLLTTEAVLGLLRARAEGITAELRKKNAAARLTEADRSQALVLYWYRGALLAAGDREFLKSLNPKAAREFDAAAGAGFLGGMPEGGGVSGGGAGASQAGALLGRLRAGLILDDGGDPGRRAALERLLSRMLESPTAAELSEKLLAEGVKVRVAFEPFPNSRLVDVGGKKFLYAVRGRTEKVGSEYVVKLNRDMLQEDPYFSSVWGPSTLGHELLGHAAEYIAADKRGVRGAYESYSGNETGASLAGWLVGAELSGRDARRWNNQNMWGYLGGPEAYGRAQELADASYADTFSLREFSDPVATLKSRRERAAREREAVAARAENLKLWRGFVAELSADPVKKASLRRISAEIDYELDALLPQRLEALKEIEEYLGGRIEFYGSREGKALAAQARSPAALKLFAERERDTAQRRERLEGLLKAQGRVAPAAGVPASDGQLGWEELAKLRSEAMAKTPAPWWKVW